MRVLSKDTSEYLRPTNQKVYVRHHIWIADVESVVTGETVTVSYYQNCVIPDESFANSEVREHFERQAAGRLQAMIEEAQAGWAYLPAYDRVGLITTYVSGVLEDLPMIDGEVDRDTLRDLVTTAIRAGNHEYESHRAVALRLGAAVDTPHTWGWRFPIKTNG